MIGNRPSMTNPKLDHIGLELTNYCNLACWMCPHSEMERSIGFMDMDLIRNLSKQFADIGIDFIVLHGIGESILHKHLREILEVIRKDSPKIRLRMSTNASFLTVERFQKLEGLLDELVVSIDGTDQITQSKHRSGSDYFQVVENVQKVLAYKRDSKTPRPQLEIRMIDLGQGEMVKSKFKNFWSNQVYGKDRVYITPSTSFGGQVDSINKRIKSCSFISHYSLIHWNGDVTTCCWDAHGKNIVGNLKNKKLEELFLGPKFSAYRTMHENKTLQKQKELLCHTCLQEAV